ncbi:MAG TPA: glutamate--tRNA ligase family protein [Vicinamibacterales bacterium]|nr:glutamate--tRNA ligase family protein [Vicinamibacterales bacterium]
MVELRDPAGPEPHHPVLPLTRFAPAPTGHLHLGHVANAIYVWGMARARDARVMLRIEDHDRQRCRPDYERALLDDLEWLGFVPDMYPPFEFRAGRCEGRQSDRDAVYRAALRPLVDSGLVFGCDCSRKEVGGSEYPGTCRTRGLPLADGIGWRVRMEPGIERFDDVLIGPQSQDPATEFGDLLVRDRLGNWTYHWAAATDDTLQGVTLVIRGVDLLDSTGRQLRLARLLGRRDPPVFAHHPLIMKSATQKLSKSDRDTGIRDLRKAGWSPQQLIGLAAYRVGLQADDSAASADDVSRFFVTQ